MTVSFSRRVVDTNVISYIFKGDSRGLLYKPHLEGHQLVISFQTPAELNVWALTARWGESKKIKLRELLSAYVLIPWDEQLSQHYAFARSHSLKAGKTIDPADAWIAATALALGCPLVTHNANDFSKVPGLQIITGQIITGQSITEQIITGQP